MKSRAVALFGPRSVKLQELEVPSEPRAGGAIIEIIGNGICGSDWDVYSGKLSKPGGKLAPFPMVLGHEPVGRVVSIDAAAAENWRVGVGDTIAIESRVRCGVCEACLGGRPVLCRNAEVYGVISMNEGSGLWGGMADFMEIRANSSVFKVPEGLSAQDAVLFNPLGNAFHWTAEAGKIGVGDRVLILGCGQRGLSCALAAREAGASQVIVTGLERDAHKLALAGSFGAHHSIVVERQNTVDVVHELTNGRGVDAVIDTVPEAAAPILHGIESLRKGGTLVVAGVRGKAVDGFPLERIRSKQLHMVGVSGTTAWAVTNALRVISEGKYPFHLLHSHTLSLDEAERGILALGAQIAGENPIHITICPK